ncbi:MAG: ATP-dependent DNA helicase RecG [Arenimonas sp.]|nr:ATP-dependent DNA helicase RecG [Arenimonas sp.]
MQKPEFSTNGLRPVTELKGVGPALKSTLAARGIHVMQDLWLQLPIGFEDRTRIDKLDNLQLGQTAHIEVRVVAIERGFRYRPMLKVIVEDDSLRQLCLRFFHYSSQQANQFAIGKTLQCYGQVRLGAQHFEMVHPSYRFISENLMGVCKDRLDPIYSNFEGIGALTLSKLVQQSLQFLPDDGSLELIPAQFRQQLGLMELSRALRELHQPLPGMQISEVISGRHPAIRRLVFEELLAHHLSLRQLREAIKVQAAKVITKDHELSERLIEKLSFQLTAAQQRVIGDIYQDLAIGHPMLRLVQGDVGCGKTVVAALAALAVISAGGQVALMAPTELLAEQHAISFQAWFEPLGIDMVYLIGKQSAKQRKHNLQQIADGAPMVIGTHALMQEHVQFQNLVLVIVDEQHRFGVHQRLSLRDKGESGSFSPHQLILTATPIPRTLAMSAYADLDVSVIDQLPPGRIPVQTVAIANSRREEVIARIAHLCQQGSQVYWVCTLIDESEEIQAQSAQAAFDLLAEHLPMCSIALLHSKVPQADKKSIMQSFKAKQIQILVATTVIEVGVDVPNASVMVIENAERLGLAQLHQLRGRVGRGSAASHCILLYQTPLSAMAKERIDVMRQTNNGFLIAEKDLLLRGPGEILGTKQTGGVAYRIADLSRDAGLLPEVIELSNQLLINNPFSTQQIVNRWVGSASRFAYA